LEYDLTSKLKALSLLAQPAPAQAGVVGFFNVFKYGGATRRGHNKKTDIFLTDDHIRLRSLLFAASISSLV